MENTNRDATPAGRTERPGDSQAEVDQEILRETAEGSGVVGDMASNRNLSGSSTWTTLPVSADADRRGGSPTDLERVSQEIAGRLAAVGVRLAGDETPDQLVQLQEAVERFETVVQARGGDLMMDETPRGGSSEPDDPHFALPSRPDHETVAQYLVRLSRATDEVRRHPTKS
jgi:hypothetical protein